MKIQFMNHPGDVQWLLETHLANRPELNMFSSFVLYGNEDCPSKVDLYVSQNPTWGKVPDHTVTFF